MPRTLGRQMAVFGHARALRAILLACSMAWLGPATDVSAAPLDSSGAAELTGRSTEPFGLLAATLFAGGLWEKWREVERKLEDDRVQLALCDGDRDRCVSSAALQL